MYFDGGGLGATGRRRPGTFGGDLRPRVTDGPCNCYVYYSSGPGGNDGLRERAPGGTLGFSHGPFVSGAAAPGRATADGVQWHGSVRRGRLWSVRQRRFGHRDRHRVSDSGRHPRVRPSRASKVDRVSPWPDHRVQSGSNGSGPNRPLGQLPRHKLPAF